MSGPPRFTLDVSLQTSSPSHFTFHSVNAFRRPLYGQRHPQTWRPFHTRDMHVRAVRQRPRRRHLLSTRGRRSTSRSTSRRTKRRKAARSIHTTRGPTSRCIHSISCFSATSATIRAAPNAGARRRSTGTVPRVCSRYPAAALRAMATGKCTVLRTRVERQRIECHKSQRRLTGENM